MYSKSSNHEVFINMRKGLIKMNININHRNANFILLQWLVVDGFQRCNLKLLFRQTRLSPPDSAPLQAIQFR